jgi:hypothetical protein
MQKASDVVLKIIELVQRETVE